MAGEVVNLRRARKAKARAEAEAGAAENRVRFGRTLAERRQAEAEAAREAARHEGHRRDPGGDGRDP